MSAQQEEQARAAACYAKAAAELVADRRAAHDANPDDFEATEALRRAERLWAAAAEEAEASARAVVTDIVPAAGAEGNWTPELRRRELDRWQQARRVYEQALLDDSGDPAVLRMLLGWAHKRIFELAEQLNERPDDLAELRDYTRRDPGDTAAASALEYIEATQQQPAEAGRKGD